MTRINFTNNTNNNTFVGRNGTGMCRGIEVLDLTDKNPPKVMIAPINSKGKVANCNIDIPVEDIPALIAALSDYVKVATDSTKCYYSLNMVGRSAFIATNINIDPTYEGLDELLSEARERNIVYRDDLRELINVARIDADEYRQATGLVVGAEVDVTAKDGDIWSGVIYRAEITKIVGDTITIEYSNEDEGDVCWDVDTDQCKISE